MGRVQGGVEGERRLAYSWRKRRRRRGRRTRVMQGGEVGVGQALRLEGMIWDDSESEQTTRK